MLAFLAVAGIIAYMLLAGGIAQTRYAMRHGAVTPIV